MRGGFGQSRSNWRTWSNAPIESGYLLNDLEWQPQTQKVSEAFTVFPRTIEHILFRLTSMAQEIGRYGSFEGIIAWGETAILLMCVNQGYNGVRMHERDGEDRWRYCVSGREHGSLGGLVMMKYLLDTHIWLRSLMEPDRISVDASALLQDSDNEFLTSPLTFWETIILAERGRIELHQIQTL